jgi:hypothetical protein
MHYIYIYIYIHIHIHILIYIYIYIYIHTYIFIYIIYNTCIYIIYTFIYTIKKKIPGLQGTEGAYNVYIYVYNKKKNRIARHGRGDRPP